jgi:hypothetical protein
MWSRTRNEIMFSTLANTVSGRVMIVPYTLEGGRFRPGRPVAMHDALVAVTPMPTQVGRFMDLHPDGQRLAVALRPGATASPESGVAAAGPSTVILIQNFFDDLRRRMSAQ